jgi:hypothetical protein
MTRKSTASTNHRSTKKSKLQKTYNNIKLLSLATHKARKQIIRHGSKDLINSICECCHNILKGHVHLSTKQKASLASHKNDIRAVGNKRTSLKRKRAIIQAGGFPLGAIIAPALSVLGSILFGGSRQ